MRTRARGFSPYPPGAMTPPPGGWRAAVGPIRSEVTRGHRLVRLLARAIFLVVGGRVHAARGATLPLGPCVLAVGPHRSARDAVALLLSLPAAPRIWGIGLGPAISGPLLRRLLRRTGGIVPIYRGHDFAEVQEAATAIVTAGARIVIMSEGGIAGPPDTMAEFRPGAALLAHRLGLPLVGVALVHRGRHWVAIVEPPSDLSAMTGTTPGSREELRAAITISQAMADRLDVLAFGPRDASA